jgi:hypothetical protein
MWLSEKNYMMEYTDLYGSLLSQELVRGSTDSCCECLGLFPLIVNWQSPLTSETTRLPS